MISSNYDAIIAATKKTDIDLNKKTGDFLNTLTNLSSKNNPTNKKSDLFDLLTISVKNKVENITNNADNTNKTDVISKENLDEILLKVHSFNFVSALSSTHKNSYDKYDKYKNGKNDYEFLYNDFNLKYQELIYKHKQLEDINKK